ncbi:zinc finger protein [Trichonephila inaurata madagascariensis]|uniref:Zinc finger protein n=1 Tax=Trichonephila inaurata madagascariensis TaxID=2747483 RepID=A0A8X6YPT3_9ARAC|nr:zinc finger protein [Trichonephila inaurata madagascariensis]
MEYRCNSCNLDFPDIYDYFHHECKFYDAQYHMQVCNDLSMNSYAFEPFKSSNEGHTASIYLNKEDNMCISKKPRVEAVSQIIDFLQCNENQSWKETPNEKSALENVFNKIEYCTQDQGFTHERIPECNLNQPSTSNGTRQISENIVQNSSIPPSVFSGFGSFQASIWEMNQYHDNNQQTVSAECNPMEYYNIRTVQNCEANDPVVKIGHGYKQEYKSSSQSRMSLENINLNLEKYSEMYRRNLHSLARSNVLYEEQEHEYNECTSQRNAIAILEKECIRNAPVKMSEPCSLLTKCSNFNAGENSPQSGSEYRVDFSNQLQRKVVLL